MVGALLAGVFEETGRYVAFKFILKKRENKATALAYGLAVFMGAYYCTYKNK